MIIFLSDLKAKGLKYIDGRMEIVSLCCSWVKKSMRKLLAKYFGSLFKFSSNLKFKDNVLEKLSSI